MLKKNLLLVFSLFVLIQINAQVKWPEISQQTKPWTRWWWLGSQVNNSDLTTLMEQYKQAGLGGLEITPIYGVQKEEDQYIDFLSPQWMQVFTHTLKEGKRLDMGIDLANATGWPFGGPWISDEYACKNMQLKTFTLQGGQSLSEKIEFIQQPLITTANYKPRKIEDILFPVAANKNLQELSLDQVRYSKPLPLQTLMAYNDKGESIELTSKVDANGKLNWEAPFGNWKLYALFMGWHGKQVERAAPGGEGNVIDHFSAEALNKYLDRFDVAFKDVDLSGLRAFFNDSYEVDDARGEANYTPDLFKEFETRRGYDLKTELPALFTKTHSERTNRILCDYRMTIDELILEDFTGEWKKWADKYGKIVRNQSHGSPANTLDLYGVVDVPETEGTEILRIKFAPSTTHVMGKQLAAAEAATWLNEHFVSSLSDVKKALDVYFVGGVNHIVYHGTTYSPPSEPWPGRLFYAAVEFDPVNPFWNHFSALNEYVARVQSFMQAGKPDNDVLLYFPIYDKYSEPAREMLLHFDGMKPDFNGTPFETSAQWMYDKGYAFDYISDRQIAQLQNEENKIATGGTSYQTILLPDAKFMKAETFQKLVTLAQNGATIIALKKMPEDVPGFGQLESNQALLKQLQGSMTFTSFVGGVQQAAVGKGKFLLGDDLSLLMQAAGIRSESMVKQQLQFNRRKNSEGNNVYFITNTSKEPLNAWVPLSTNTQAVVLYNPMTQAAGVADCRRNAGGIIEIKLQLKPEESVIAETHDEMLSAKKFPVYPYFTSAASIAINGPWQLKFTEGGPAMPPPVTLTTLQNWTTLSDPAYAVFSGTGTYTTNFKRPAGNASAYLLNLGEVDESATVLINGKKIATLIGPEFSCIIDASALSADNLLEVQVANSMANRIIDMDKKKVFWKKFNNTNFPARLAQNRGSDGIFNASKWEPRSSGLLGPVTITAIEITKKF